MPVDLSVWVIADPLTVEQAACLWAGVDPSSNRYLRAQADQTRVEAYQQAIAGAIAGAELAADSSRNALARIGNYDSTLVNRAELKRFAEARGQRPAFLFDTLLSGASVGDIESLFPARAPDVEQLPAPPRGGRPPEYDWDAFTIEIIRIADMDNLPERQADLVRQMMVWCQSSWGKEPAESSVKSRISAIYNGLGRGRKPGAP